ncbi:hypothetical protein ACE38W_01175 [Chitinophaga sp. Hz27]|uniref:hypothetical protein n=1 Tax=Chitinophaga sp. Hz27 TaxID=3347169 RepID=UPI0035D9C0D6
MRNLLLFIPLFAMMGACNQHSGQSGNSDTTAVAKDSAGSTAAVSTPSPEVLIIPGKQIGMTVIHANADSLIKILGKPDFSDAAMGTYFNSWYKRHTDGIYQTSIYSQRNMGGPDEAITHVKSVYVSSPAFKTSERLGAGSAASVLKEHFTLQRGGVYSNAKDSLVMYDDIPHGISFEINKEDKCSGVLVYAAGDTAAARLPVHQDMKYQQ